MLVVTYGILGKKWESDQFFYDLGFSVLIATAVGGFAELVFRRFDQHEQELESQRIEFERREEQLEAERKERDARRWKAIEDELENLGVEMDTALRDADDTLAWARHRSLELRIEALEHLVGGLGEQIKATRRRVDPDYDRSQRILDAPPRERT